MRKTRDKKYFKWKKETRPGRTLESQKKYLLSLENVENVREKIA